MNQFTAVTQQDERGICCIDLAGYLDAHTATELESIMNTAITNGCSRIVVNFADLEYISSAGLGVFMVFIKSLQPKNDVFKLAAMKPKVFTVFDLLGFPVLFEIYPTVEEAKQAFPSLDA